MLTEKSEKHDLQRKMAAWTPQDSILFLTVVWYEMGGLHGNTGF